eukprot:scaffold3471_cov175-Amphora_coffeaeformis.AAC.10
MSTHDAFEEEVLSPISEPLLLRFGADLVWTCREQTGAHIYVGPKQAASRSAMDALRQCHITGIINCTTDIPCYHRRQNNNNNCNINNNEEEEQGNSHNHNHNHNIRYCQVPVEDVETANLKEYFPGACAFLHEILMVRRESVLVHCHFGVSRSASIVLAYLLRDYHNMTLDEASRFIKYRRPKICPNRGFWNQLQEWEKENREKVREESSIPQPVNLSFSSLRSSYTWFVTCRDVPNILDQLHIWSWMETITRNEEDGLIQCLDFIWERGGDLGSIDLEWFRTACGVWEKDNEKTLVVERVLGIASDSEFGARHVVHQRQIDRLIRFLLVEDEG